MLAPSSAAAAAAVGAVTLQGQAAAAAKVGAPRGQAIQAGTVADRQVLGARDAMAVMAALVGLAQARAVRAVRQAAAAAEMQNLGLLAQAGLMDVLR
jgi:hypothetical protein